MAADIVRHSHTAFSAQLIDFAVRHYIKIIETRPKKGWFAAEYDIQVVKDVSELVAEEQEILRDIFGHDPSVGERLSLKTLKNNSKIYRRTLDNPMKLRELIRGEYGLRAHDSTLKRGDRSWATLMLIVGLLMFQPLLVVMSIILFILSANAWPLTDEGLRLKRYLLGLRLYISVAETERLKMLQSPDGAEKVGAIDVDDAGQVVKLYERVLPYAVLFGLEKDWNKQLGRYYESMQANPDWYESSSGNLFQAAAFGAAMSSFASAAQYSSPSSSSSGGSSGGGGGGGGGGGW